MFQVFFAVLKITPSFYCSAQPITDSLSFHQPTPFIIVPPLLTPNPSTIRHGRVRETRDDRLHVKLDDGENLKNLKKTVGLTSNLEKNKNKRKWTTSIFLC